jgi:two-component system chemotaxis response regulator CheY
MPKLIVIVEDSETIAPLEIALASLDGVVIQEFSNGRDAVKFVRAEYKDMSAIITDLHLPFFDGFELVAAVKEDERCSQIPIIVLSGDTHPETPERLRDLGVNAFFAKPYSPAQVRDTLEALLHVK